MATMIPGNRQAHDFLPRPTPIGPNDSPLAHPFQASGPVDEIEVRTQQLSLLVEVNATLSGALDVEAALGTVLSRLVDRERFCHASIFRLHPQAEELRRVAWSGQGGEPAYTIPLHNKNPLARVACQQQPVYLPHADNSLSGKEDCPAAMETVYIVPMQTHTRLLGVFAVASDRREGIRSVTRKLIDQVAAQAALALERSDLYQQLRVSEERFRSIFEQVHIGVAVADLGGRFSTVNPAFARLMGYDCEELQGVHFADITHSQDVEGKQQAIETLREIGTGQATLETRYLRKSGEAVWCSTNISLLHDAKGQPAYFLGIVQNIDERKKAEEERKRLQRQLFQAQKMEALGTLAGGIAHDFNNLLSVMLGFASLARQRLSSEDPLQDSMGMIEESAHRAAALARQLLGFARPERQQETAVCVDDVLDRVSRMVTRTFDRNIAIVTRKCREPLWVNAEPSYLEQALLNMCINARDAMPQGGTLTLEAVSARLKAPGGEDSPASNATNFVIISVEDTGVGIAPEALPRVFEPFFTTKGPDRGSGLGLAMVYGFAKSHGGHVKVESERGRGSRFTISLPLISPPEAQAGAVGLEQLEPGKGTVLVVDDEPMVRAFAVEGLKGLGYQVWSAENGLQALQLYEQHVGEIDFVLMDLIMPELGGLETFRRMRALNPQARIVFASGYSTGEILRDAPDARAAMFIGKPYTLAGLATALRKAGMGKPL